MLGLIGCVVDLEVAAVSWASLGRRGDVGPELRGEGELYNLPLLSGLAAIIFLLRVAGLLEPMLVWAAGSKISP